MITLWAMRCVFISKLFFYNYIEIYWNSHESSNWQEYTAKMLTLFYFELDKQLVGMFSRVNIKQVHNEICVRKWNHVVVAFCFCFLFVILWARIHEALNLIGAKFSNKNISNGILCMRLRAYRSQEFIIRFLYLFWFFCFLMFNGMKIWKFFDVVSVHMHFE